MSRIFGLAATILTFAIAACTTTTTGSVAGDGTRAIRMARWSDDRIAERHVEEVNAIRAGRGLSMLVVSPELSKAAKAHAQDMSRQNRPWHFGSDGSTPLDRAARAGFTGEVLGENISETYESDSFTLKAWMEDPITRAVILDPNATVLGIGYQQDPNNKLWWVQMTGR